MYAARSGRRGERSIDEIIYAGTYKMPLTPTQLDAATSTDQSITVLAGAGSGKTRVLIERYRRLVVENKIPPYRILAFTFTEKASQEMKERILKEKIIEPFEEAICQISTIHAFCSRLLRQYGPRVGLDPSYSILDATEVTGQRETRMKDFLLKRLNQNEEIVAKYTNRFGFGRFSKLFSHLVQDPVIHQSKYGHDGKFCDDTQLLNMAKSFCDEWLEEKLSNSTLTFNDLEYLSIILLTTHPEVRDKLTTRYQHILVDEFQDTNPLQGTLINKLYNPSKNKLFIVGDPHQSIYRFRLADVSIFYRMKEQIESNKGRVISLKDTFRILEPITSTINTVFGFLFKDKSRNQVFEPLNSFEKDKKAKIQFIVAPKDKNLIGDTRRQEAEWIANYLASLNLSSDQRDATAILFRSGKPIKIYKEALDKVNIPCQVTKTNDLLCSPEIRDLLHILSYLAGETSLITQVGILRSCYFQLSEIFIDYYIRSKPKNFSAPYIPDLFMQEEDNQKWQHLSKLFESWESLKEILPPATLFSKIYLDLDIAHNNSIRANEQAQLNIEQWLYMLREWGRESHLSLTQIYKAILSIRESGEEIKTLEPKNVGGRVHLMTIHAAKGLEFDRVFLPQLVAPTTSPSTDFLFDKTLGLSVKIENPNHSLGLKPKLEETPLFTQIKEVEEREEREELKRLLYVAMTRAKNELILFLKEPTHKKIDVEKSTNWNEWLWTLLDIDKLDTIQLITQKQSPVAFAGLAKKIHQSLDIFTDETENKETEQMDIKESQPENIIPVHKPTYTATAIETYLRCGKEYELRYIYGIEPVAGKTESQEKRPFTKLLPSLAWGNLVHEVLQFIDLKTRANEHTVIEQALSNQQIRDADGKIKEKIMSTIDSLLLDPQIKDLLLNQETCHKELPFIYDGQTYFLRGTFDRLSQKENQWTIVDYKTDHLSDSHEMEARTKAYDGQMASYALAASQILGVQKISTALLFTDGPYLQTKEWDALNLEETSKLLSTINESLCKNEVTPFKFPQNQSICHHCPYFDLNYCGVRNE